MAIKIAPATKIFCESSHNSLRFCECPGWTSVQDIAEESHCVRGQTSTTNVSASLPFRLAEGNASQVWESLPHATMTLGHTASATLGANLAASRTIKLHRPRNRALSDPKSAGGERVCCHKKSVAGV